MTPRRVTVFAAVLLALGRANVHGAPPELQPELQAELDENYKKAIALREKGRWAEALPLSARAAELAPKVFGADHLNTGALLNNLGTNYFELRRFDEAEKAFVAALAVREKHAKAAPAQCLMTLNNLAILTAGVGKLAVAFEYHERCAAIESETLPAEHRDRHRRALDMARLAVRLGRMDDAQALLKKRLQQEEEAFGAEHGNLGETLLVLADAYVKGGKLVDAEPYARRACKIGDGALAKNDAFTCDANELFANVCYQLAKYEDGVEPLRRCLAVRERGLGKDHPAVAKTLTRLAEHVMYCRPGPEAEALLQRSLAIHEKVDPESPECARTHQAFLIWHYVLGRFAEAEKHGQRSVDVLEKKFGKDDVSLLSAFQWLGLAQVQQNHLLDAERSFRRGLQIGERAFGKDSRHAAPLLNDLAKVCGRTKRVAEAEGYARRSLAILRKTMPPGHPGIIATEHNLAKYLYLGGKLDEARAGYEECLKAAEANNDTGGIANTLGSLAHLNMLAGRRREAFAQQSRVLEFDQRGLRNVFAFGSESTMFSFLESRNALLPSMISMAAVAAAKSDGDADRAAQEAACTWTLRLQSIVFDTVCRYRQAGRLSPDPAFKKRLDEYRDLKQRVADAALAPKGDERGHVDEWKRRLERLEGELNAALSAQAAAIGDPWTVTAADVRAKLPPRSALALFVDTPVESFESEAWLPNRLFVFVLTPGQKTARLVDLGPTRPIEADVAALRKEFDDFQEKLAECETNKEAQALEKAREPVFRKKASALYAKVIAPLAKEIGDAELLFLVPDAGLNRLPFEALVDEQGKYLAERRRCVYLSSGRDLLRPETKPAGAIAKGVAVFAGPDFKVSSAERQAVATRLLGKELVASRGSARGVDVRSAGWKPLPGAAAEADDIRDLLKDTPFGPVKTYTGAEAMEEMLKALPPPRILHLATHGFYLDLQTDATGDDGGGAGAGTGAGAARGRLKKQDNPLLRSGIVLAGANAVGDGPQSGDDGWVTAEEIALLNLHGAELVVLSACQTGLGEVRNGEGVFGLRRAFLFAGARTLLTSLFEVPDSETRDLMKRFYRGLKDGQTKSASLAAAQRATIAQRRDSHGAAHPFYWASFVLIGDPR